jgi:hypothetical protein
MKLLLPLFLLSLNTTAQVPKNGTYIYNWCDIEYNKCLGPCKVKISGNRIWIFAPANLSGIKEGDLYETGIISKHISGKWVIVDPRKKKDDQTTENPLTWIDFKRKQFWTF